MAAAEKPGERGAEGEERKETVGERRSAMGGGGGGGGGAVASALGWEG